jgi:hypothetical protein
MVNYKTIIQDLSGIAFYHQQIRSFGYGDITQITMDIDTKKEPVFTRMYVVPGQVILNQNRIDYNFSIIILDRINDDYSNQPDVMSDTLEITKDIFTILYQSYTADFGGFSIDYEPLWNSSVSPFLERFETILGGWTLNITIEQPFDYNKCLLPFEGLSLPTSVYYNNYKQVISDLKSIGNSHKQINSVGFGDVTQLTMDVETDKEPLYTKMYIVPNPVSLNQNEIIYNFQISVMDRINIDLSNQRDVMNDTLEIMKDIFTILYLSQYQSQWGATLTPFLEEYETILGGWTININITQPFSYNRCDIPIPPFVKGNKKWNELAELWNFISQNWKDV